MVMPPRTRAQDRRETKASKHAAASIKASEGGASSEEASYSSNATSTHCGLNLPTDMLRLVKSYLDGLSLSNLEIAVKGVVQDSDYQEASRAYDWVLPIKPKHITRWKDFYMRIRQSCYPVSFQSASGDKDGRIPGAFYVIGGSNNRTSPLSSVDRFNDIGGSKVENGRWQVPFCKQALPSLRIGRSAPAVTKDHDENIYVIGGWSGGNVLLSIERLSSSTRSSGPTTRATSSSWQPFTSLSTGRCFLAAAVNHQGHLFAFGGGDSVWQGSHVFRSTEIYDPVIKRWKAGVDMHQPRCGLASAVTARGDIYVAGGYGGGLRYWNTVEMLPSDGGEGRGWLANPCRPMRVPRTGFGLAVGPDHCLYAVGGSPDGFHSHKSSERLDPRIGTWEKLPHMITSRGYCAATFGASGLLYAVGGQSGVANDDMLMRCIEVYDPKVNKWRILPDSEHAGVARVDLALIYSLS